MLMQSINIIMSQNIKNLFAQIHESGTAKQDSSSTINDKYKNGG